MSKKKFIILKHHATEDLHLDKNYSYKASQQQCRAVSPLAVLCRFTTRLPFTPSSLTAIETARL
jgi:hypothetical protein